MSKEVIRLEIKGLAEIIKEQQEVVLSHTGKIPQLEIDLLMGNIRKLYEAIHTLDKLNRSTAAPVLAPDTTPVPSSPAPAPESKPEIPHHKQPEELLASIPVVGEIIFDDEEPAEPEVVIASSTPAKHQEPEMQQEKVIVTKDAMPPHPVQPELIVATVETPVVPAKDEKVAEDVLPQAALAKERAREYSKPTQKHTTASLFDETPTVAEKFQGAPTVYDKFSNVGEDKSIAGKMQKNPVEDLKKSIGINQKFSFINELFDGDSNSYHQAIEKLNSSNGLEQAEAFLTGELAVKHGWSSEGQAFRQLQDLVSRRFSA